MAERRVAAQSQTRFMASGIGGYEDTGGGHGGNPDDVETRGGASGHADTDSDNDSDGRDSGESFASAAAVDTAAFNQDIIMGANVLGNTVDMTVVGGSMSSSYAGDDGNDRVQTPPAGAA